VKITATGPAYYHHDGLGSTIALTGENGTLLESYRYDAFGAVTILSPSTFDPRPSTAFGNRFLFTGREWLSQVGLYDYRNRVYSASIGRFLQTDPIRFAAGDVNIYRYVGNNSVNLIDPTGKIAILIPIFAFEKCIGLVITGWIIMTIADPHDFEDGNSDDVPEEHPLKNREKRNKERRERPKDPQEKERRQRDYEEKKRRSGGGGSNQQEDMNY